MANKYKTSFLQDWLSITHCYRLSKKLMMVSIQKGANIVVKILVSVIMV